MAYLYPDSWFALQIKPKREKLVSFLLRQKGYEEFLPLYKPRSAVRRRPGLECPLFPGYLFCRITEQAAGRVVTTPGVVRIVGVGNRPEAICEEEIDRLKAVVESGLNVASWARLEYGEPVMLDDGPLRGCHGTFLRWQGEGRLIVSVTLLQRSVAVAVRDEWVVPLSTEARPRAATTAAPEATSPVAGASGR